MLPNETIIAIVNYHGPHEDLELTKEEILGAVRALYLAEDAASIQPTDRVRAELAAVLVAHCLEAR